MHNLMPVVIVLLVAFSIYRRTMKTIGFQKFVKGRLLTRMTLFLIIGAIILAIGYLKPIVYVYDAIGIIVGGVIAYYAIRSTSFEWRKDAWYYRPNPWIGVALIILAVGRIAYRVYQDYSLLDTGALNNQQAANQSSFAAYGHDPITATILFILVTYYFVYYTFLIRKERSLETKAHDVPEM